MIFSADGLAGLAIGPAGDTSKACLYP